MRLISECCKDPPLDDSNSTCSGCLEHTGFVVTCPEPYCEGGRVPRTAHEVEHVGPGIACPTCCGVGMGLLEVA